MGPQTLEAFERSLEGYLDLRRRALMRVGPRPARATAREIESHQRALGDVIRRARLGAGQGDVFTPRVEEVFRRILLRAFTGPRAVVLLHAIRQGNPAWEGVPSATDPNVYRVSAQCVLRR